MTENPTHNTAIKIFKLRGLQIYGIPLTEKGIDLERLDATLAAKPVKAGFLIPSYHNPTGLVMSPESRRAVLAVFARYQVPIIEDGSMKNCATPAPTSPLCWPWPAGAIMWSTSVVSPRSSFPGYDWVG